MTKKDKPRRGRFGVSRREWLAAALDALERGGIDAVRVQTLAAIVGVNKSGFYYHFKDRNALMSALIDYWSSLEQRPLEEFDGDPLEAPADALRVMATVVDRDYLARYDSAIRLWAKNDDAVAAAYEEKIRRRLDIARSLFHALGFEGLACEVRARTYVGFVSAEREIFRDQSPPERAALREAHLSLLLCKL